MFPYYIVRFKRRGIGKENWKEYYVFPYYIVRFKPKIYD
ncbi:hypothetical protein MSIBF_A1440002 [groundwater metagenome]|uniref:Uncharacterized protein n=1 Tax=groundwater metagenome TaxID=717931 RepID=A0A098E7D5_9ZZZZ